jgi:hypothetical protein
MPATKVTTTPPAWGTGVAKAVFGAAAPMPSARTPGSSSADLDSSAGRVAAPGY